MESPNILKDKISKLKIKRAKVIENIRQMATLEDVIKMNINAIK